MTEAVDLAIVGAGAAGLMAAIQAGRSAPGKRILLLDGARSLGAKILVAGGGRCNVTHYEVSADDFAGSSRNSIAKVLRELPVPATGDFFRGLGVELKREPTGKLFPATDQARTVLEALLRAAREAGVQLLYPRRVTAIRRAGAGFVLAGEWGEVTARRVILAAGGQALPKSGSDGSGYALARALGNTTTATIFPALVPLIVPDDHWLRTVQGIAVPARIEVRAGTGKRLAAFRGDLLCTHFGLSGPVVLDASRHYLAARQTDRQARFVVAFLPEATAEGLTLELANLSGMEALVDAIVSRGTSLLPREGEIALAQRQREALADAATALRVSEGSQDILIMAESIRAARAALDRLTGDGGIEPLLDAIFSRFCIGK